MNETEQKQLNLAVSFSETFWKQLKHGDDLEEVDMEKATDSWKKFQQVDDLLLSVNDYMDIYTRMKESGQISTESVIGSFGDKNPMHRIPDSIDDPESTWPTLTKEKQLEAILEQGRQTTKALEELLARVKETYGDRVDCCLGPMKSVGRIEQKRDKDYEGEIRRVIDVVRCSFILADMATAKEMISSLQIDDGLEKDSFVMKGWDIVRIAKEMISSPQNDDGVEKDSFVMKGWDIDRIKDGFEKAENFLVGGYRDIKLNLLCKPTGHIVEVQLHLRPYFELKNNGGHKHYEFARTLNLQGVTEAMQILSERKQGDDEDGLEIRLLSVIQVGNSQLRNLIQELNDCTDPQAALMLRFRTAKVTRRIGEIYSGFNDMGWVMDTTVRGCCTAAVKYFTASLTMMERIKSEEELLPNSSNDDDAREEGFSHRTLNVEFAQVLVKYARSLVQKSFQQAIDSYYDDEDEETDVDEETDEEEKEIENGCEDTIILASLDRGVAICTETLGPKHPFTLLAKSNRYEYLLKAQFERRDKFRKRLGYDDWTGAQNAPMDGDPIVEEINAYNDAVEKIFQDFETLIQDQIQIVGAGHPYVLKTQHMYSLFLIDSRALKHVRYCMESFPKGYTILLDALEAGINRLGPNHTSLDGLTFAGQNHVMGMCMDPDNVEIFEPLVQRFMKLTGNLDEEDPAEQQVQENTVAREQHNDLAREQHNDLLFWSQAALVVVVAALASIGLKAVTRQ